MIRVLLVTANDALAARLTEAIGAGFQRVSPQALGGSLDSLGLAGSAAELPHIVVLDGSGQEHAALETAQDLGRRGVSTILVSPAADELALPALRVGVRDLLTPGAPAEEIREALDRTAQSVVPVLTAAVQPAGVPQALEGRVIAVVSPKGGVGKTTVATNLAVGLAARAPQSTVLVDLDVHFGDVASALNLQPEHSLPDVTRGPVSRDSIALKSYLTLHETGLYVVPGSDSPAAADAVTPQDAVSLLRVLRQQFSYVIVDTAPGLSEHTLGVLDESDTLVMVTSLDVPGVRGLRKEIDTLAELQLTGRTRFVVLNFNDVSRGLSIADVEATIRTNVDVAIPQSKLIPLSVNQGIPLLQSNGRDPVTQRLRMLVDLVAAGQGVSEAPLARRGIFARRAR